MRTQEPDGCRIRVSIRTFDPAVRKVFVRGVVQGKFGLRGQDHERCGCERLGDGRQGKRRMGRYLQASLAIGPSKTLFPDDVSAVHHSNRDSRGLSVRDSLKDQVPHRLKVVFRMSSDGRLRVIPVMLRSR